MNKSYSELMTLKTYDERIAYLQTHSTVGTETLASYRYLSQKFYSSSTSWKRCRRDAILRDNGCDLGLEDLPLDNNIFVHHINPLTAEDFMHNTNKLYDMNNLITVSKATHDIIHYAKPIEEYVERDFSIPWKGGNT